MYDVLRFWLDKGVDGFRVDVIYKVVKDEQFRDNPPNPDYQPGQDPYKQFLSTYNADHPEVHDVIAEMRAVVDEYSQRLLVGEIYLPVERLVTYYGAAGRGAHLPFNFQLITLPWHARVLAQAIDHYEAALPEYGWPNWVLGNHDKPRLASRIGPAQARVAAMLLLTLRGTPTIYCGEEIGMHNVPIPPDCVQDPFEKNVPGLGLGRDPCRTPMQWDASAHAGFTTGKPWLPLAADADRVNVEVQTREPRSSLALYRALIDLRRGQPALSVGAYRSLPCTDDILAFRRHEAGKQFVVVLNFSHQPHSYELPPEVSSGRIVLSTHLDRDEPVTRTLALREDEGVIVEVSA
jgi:alpha-glucosidase